MAISKKALLLLVVLVGAIGIVVKFVLDPFSTKEESPKTTDTSAVKPAPVTPPTPTPTTSAPVPSTETTTETAPAVANRKLMVDTTYESPAGTEPVGFTLVVDGDGVIVSAETAVKATVEASVKFQQDFKANLPGKVVGKKLSDLAKVDKVGKASLTTGAFNASLTKLQAQL